MNDNKIIEIFYTAKGKINPHLTGNWLDEHVEYKNYLNSRFNDSQSVGETLYRIKHHIEVRPVCCMCGKPVKFSGNKKGFNETCSISCAKHLIKNVKDIYDINVILDDLIENAEINKNKLQDKYLKEHGYFTIINNVNARSKSEALYMLANSIDHAPICKICGKIARFISYKDGYDEYCSDICKNTGHTKKIIDDEYVIDLIFSDDRINNLKVAPKFLKMHGVYDYISNRFNDSQSIAETLYRIWKHIEERPICKICGGKIKFINLTHGFAKTCSSKCTIENTEIIKKDNINDEYIKRLFNVNSRKYGCMFRKSQLYRSGIYDYLINRFDDCKDPKEAVYRILNNIETLPKCEICGKLVNFCGYYPKTCSQTCTLRLNKQEELRKIGLETKIYDNDIKIFNQCSKHPEYLLSRLTFNRRMNLGECLCPICNPHNTTSIEDIVKNILEKLGIKFYIHDRKHIYPLELDFYLPDFKIGIECNGIYWHSSEFKDDKTIDVKLNTCKNKSIKLLTFWESDIVNKQNIIEAIIKSQCGLNKKIFARNCQVKEISAEMSRNFINENHLQGNVNASIKLGLFYNDELVEAMTFGKLRKITNQKHIDGSYELYRLCSKSGYSIIGGASKLLKYFKTHYEWKEIISYCDKEISDGNVYEKLGFKFDKDCGKGFFYYDRNGVKFNRYSLRKNIVDDGSGRTADEILKSLKYTKCWTNGNLKFIIKNV